MRKILYVKPSINVRRIDYEPVLAASLDPTQNTGTVNYSNNTETNPGIWASSKSSEPGMIWDDEEE